MEARLDDAAAWSIVVDGVLLELAPLAVEAELDAEEAEVPAGATRGRPQPPLLGTALFGKLKLPALAGTLVSCVTQLQM